MSYNQILKRNCDILISLLILYQWYLISGWTEVQRIWRNFQEAIVSLIYIFLRTTIIRIANDPKASIKIQDVINLVDTI